MSITELINPVEEFFDRRGGLFWATLFICQVGIFACIFYEGWTYKTVLPASKPVVKKNVQTVEPPEDAVVYPVVVIDNSNQQKKEDTRKETKKIHKPKGKTESDYTREKKQPVVPEQKVTPEASALHPFTELRGQSLTLVDKHSNNLYYVYDGFRLRHLGSFFTYVDYGTANTIVKAVGDELQPPEESEYYPPDDIFYILVFSVVDAKKTSIKVVLLLYPEEVPYQVGVAKQNNSGVWACKLNDGVLLDESYLHQINLMLNARPLYSMDKVILKKKRRRRRY